MWERRLLHFSRHASAPEYTPPLARAGMLAIVVDTTYRRSQR
jgi:hypothetical protein